MESGGQQGKSSIEPAKSPTAKPSEPVVMVSVEKSSPNDFVSDKQADKKPNEEAVKCPVELDEKLLSPENETGESVKEKDSIQENGESKASAIEQEVSEINNEEAGKQNGNESPRQVKVELLDEPADEKPLSATPVKTDDEAGSIDGIKEASVEVSDETDDKKNSSTTDVMEVEDQQSSTSSSPSALHIHLDEEDKDESLNGNEMF